MPEHAEDVKLPIGEGGHLLAETPVAGTGEFLEHAVGNPRAHIHSDSGAGDLEPNELLGLAGDIHHHFGSRVASDWIGRQK